MANHDQMTAQMTTKGGFIAALDQSGGSTPGALRQYGIPETAYQGDEAMFRLMHDMRVRIITAPSFTSERILGAILFEATMDGDVEGKPVPTYLWEDRGVVPFVKVDKGLQDESDGVKLMKPMPGLDTLLKRAVSLGVYGTKMRSVIGHASPTGIAAIVKQQFEVGAQITAAGLMPIIEPEVSIGAPDKAAAESLLRDDLHAHLDKLPAGTKVMLKLTIPTEPDLYAPLIAHPHVERVVALSGGYPLHKACTLLAQNHGMIASFSRALIDDLRAGMTDAEFDTTLRTATDEIFKASTQKA